MKTKHIVFGVLALGAGGLAIYYFTKPAPTAPRPSAAQNPAGYAPGGNQTANTISQVVGIGQQAANLFGTVSNDVQNLNG